MQRHVGRKAKHAPHGRTAFALLSSLCDQNRQSARLSLPGSSAISRPLCRAAVRWTTNCPKSVSTSTRTGIGGASGSGRATQTVRSRAVRDYFDWSLRKPPIFWNSISHAVASPAKIV